MSTSISKPVFEHSFTVSTDDQNTVKDFLAKSTNWLKVIPGCEKGTIKENDEGFILKGGNMSYAFSDTTKGNQGESIYYQYSVHVQGKKMGLPIDFQFDAHWTINAQEGAGNGCIVKRQVTNFKVLKCSFFLKGLLKAKFRKVCKKEHKNIADLLK